MVVACEKVSLGVNHSVITLKGHNLTPSMCSSYSQLCVCTGDMTKTVLLPFSTI